MGRGTKSTRALYKPGSPAQYQERRNQALKTDGLIDYPSRAFASAKIVLILIDVGTFAIARHVRCGQSDFLWSGAPVEPTVVRTHSDLTTAFSLPDVKYASFGLWKF